MLLFSHDLEAQEMGANMAAVATEMPIYFSRKKTPGI